MSAKVPIDKDSLIELYKNQKLNTYQIADIYGCCQATIWKRLKEFSIKARTPYELISNVPSKEELEKLYLNEKLSTWQIQKRFGFARGTVHRKLTEYGLPSRSLAKSHMIHPRKDFSGDQIERAYLIGFRIGDLRVRKPYKNSETISIECGTTKEEQLELIKGMFEKYAYVWISKKNKKGAKNIGANLPLSFDFLLSKDEPDWVFEKEDIFFSFLAGFTDAEGSIWSNYRQTRFTLASYDTGILHKIYQRFLKLGIPCNPPAIRVKQGFKKRDGLVYRHDLWYFAISKQSTLLHLFGILSSKLKHEKRLKDLKKVEYVLKKRRANQNPFLRSSFRNLPV